MSNARLTSYASVRIDTLYRGNFLSADLFLARKFFPTVKKNTYSQDVQTISDTGFSSKDLSDQIFEAFHRRKIASKVINDENCANPLELMEPCIIQSFILFFFF